MRACSSALLPMLVINVEPASALSAEQPGLDEVSQHRAGTILRVTEVALQDLGDREHRVEADQVGQLQWAERMAEPQARPGVDVLLAADAFFEGEAGFVDERDQHAI